MILTPKKYHFLIVALPEIMARFPRFTRQRDFKDSYRKYILQNCCVMQINLK